LKPEVENLAIVPLDLGHQPALAVIANRQPEQIGTQIHIAYIEQTGLGIGGEDFVEPDGPFGRELFFAQVAEKAL
jgi:hypothetical protein